MNPPIFVVGVGRSGTTLLSAMMSAHSRLSCGPETHFFRRLAEVDARALCAAATWPGPAADFIRSITHTGFVTDARKPLTEKYRLDPGSIEKYLRGKEPTMANVLGSVTEQFMIAKGKARWIEKTPGHILYLREIRSYFPQSPIVRIVRDPRDVSLSLMKVPWGVQSFIEGILFWEQLDRQSRAFFGDDARCYTLRFEDLVTSPVETLEKLCGFLGETFEPGMLDTSATGAEINARNVPWKAKVSEAVDGRRVGAWRSEISRDENCLAEAVLGDRLLAYGYPLDHEYPRFGALHPGLDTAVKYPQALAAVAAKGVRFWKARPDERATSRIYMGEPGTREWFGDTRAGRFLKALPVFTDIARAAVAGDKLYWIPDRDVHSWNGWLSFMLRRLLARYDVARAQEVRAW
jgi:hypothetical protein